MNVRRHSPKLIVKTTTAVTLVTVPLLLLVVFVVTLSVRDQVRQAVTSNLEATQRLFAVLETRRQREMRAQAVTVAESPTLKAALDTYVAYVHTASADTKAQLFATISNELDKVVQRIEADAIVLVDVRGKTLAAAGRFAEAWPRGRSIKVMSGAEGSESYEGVLHTVDDTFRVVSVPLVLSGDEVIGTLYFATSLDHAYAVSLEMLARSQIAILANGVLLDSTLDTGRARQFERLIARAKAPDGVVDLAGESHAFRRLFQTGDTSIYALASIDDAAAPITRTAMRNLGVIAICGTLLALLGSFRLARQFTDPIGQLSASLEKMAATRDRQAQLPLTGSSRELDTLTHTFNALMDSVAAAEQQTEAAYTGAIRALAAALDARDPYTAGHSERVSVLSVAIGRVLGLPDEDLEVLRLGALLHDIGKIGVPDEVLRKRGALTSSEYDAIKAHPVLGARILRSVPFLAPHIPIVELHHERPDGRGYPHGLHDQDIPMAARIVHVADAYDAMTTARAYRGAMPAREALRELWRYAGSQFHADVVGALASALRATADTSTPHRETVSA